MAANEVKVSLVGEDKLTGPTKQAEASLTSFGGSIQSKVTGKLEELSQKIPVVGGDIAKVAGGMVQDLGPVGLAAGGVGVAFAGLAVQGVEHFLNLGGAVKQFSTVAGTTAEESSKWVAVLQQYGISAEQGEGAVGKLAKTLGNSPEALNKFGVAVAHAKDGSVDLEGTLFNVIDAYNSTDDETRKAALAQAAFGKSWQNLAPILAAGTGQLKEAFAAVPKGDILSTRDVQNAHEIELAFNHLKEAAQGFELTLAKDLAPVLLEIADDLDAVVSKADALVGPLGGLGNAAKFAFDNLSPVGQVFRDFKIGSDLVTSGLGAVSDWLGISSKGSNSWGDDMKTASEKATVGLGQVTSRTEDNKAAAAAYATVQTQLAAATETAATKLGEEGKALGDAASAGDALKASFDKLIGASLDLQKATDDEIAKEQAITQARIDNGATLDSNTEKGRANQQAIRDSIAEEGNYIDALIKGGASTDEAGQKLNEYRDRLINQAMQFGLTKEQATEYINELGLTPANIDTTVNLAHQQAFSDAAAWIAKLENTDGSGIPKSVVSQLAVDIANGSEGALQRVKELVTWLAQPHTGTVTINTVTSAVPGHASGGFAPAGVPAMFGEQGPELGIPSTGMDILTASQTAGLLSGRSAPTINIENLNVTGGTDQARAISDELGWMLRVA